MPPRVGADDRLARLEHGRIDAQARGHLLLALCCIQRVEVRLTRRAALISRSRALLDDERVVLWRADDIELPPSHLLQPGVSVVVVLMHPRRRASR